MIFTSLVTRHSVYKYKFNLVLHTGCVRLLTLKLYSFIVPPCNHRCTAILLYQFIFSFCLSRFPSVVLLSWFHGTRFFVSAICTVFAQVGNAHVYMDNTISLKLGKSLFLACPCIGNITYIWEKFWWKIKSMQSSLHHCHQRVHFTLKNIFEFIQLRDLWSENNFMLKENESE